MERQAIEPRSSRIERTRYDVVIVGGGLAGLTLALQLRQQSSDLEILVVERKPHPVPIAAHKVGESSVEIGADYFANVLGLKRHLQEEQLKKFGFRFFFSEGRRDLDRVTEVGASRYLAVASYQIDRGVFENFLAEEALRRGIAFVDGATVSAIDLAGASGDADRRHAIDCSEGGRSHRIEARWVVDASGRAGVLKKQLGLAEANGHACHSVWFRIADRLTIDEWSDDDAWRSRCDPQARWRSTNHLVGAGYWVWLIPLASGSHSVGIVADPALHPLERMSTFDKAMDWLAEHQPRLFDELEPRRALLQDFALFKRFSYGCRQVFSADRWALTGEAGVFLDPFYSPGSDFIAISNTYIADLIARDRAGQPIAQRARLYDRVYRSFYENTLALYEGQYPIFGDPQVLPVKIVWDYAYYWGVLAQIFFQRRLTDLDALGAVRDELATCSRLNRAVQAFLREWSKASDKINRAAMLDQAAMPWFVALNKSLTDARLDDAAFRERIRGSARLLRELAREIAAVGQRGDAQLDATAVMEAAGGELSPTAPLDLLAEVLDERIARPEHVEAATA